MYKASLHFLIAIGCVAASLDCYSQATAPNTVEFSSLYVPAAKYLDNGETAPNPEKSTHFRLTGGYAVPLSVRMDTIAGKVNSWTGSLNASYSQFGQPYATGGNVPERLLFSELGLVHYVTRTNNWALVHTASVGLNSDLKHIDYHDLAVNAGLLFLKTYNRNLTIGFGVFAYNAISTPLLLPGLVVNWQTAGKYKLAINLPTEISLACETSEKNEVKLAFRPKNINYDITNELFPQKRSLSYWELPISLENRFRGRKIDITLAGGLMALRSFQLYERGISNTFRSVPAQMMGAAFFLNAGIRYRL